MDGRMKPIYRNEGASVELVPVDLAEAPGAYQIYKMWADPDKRGKGYANRLAKEVCADADRTSTVLLSFPAPFSDSPDGVHTDAPGMSIERLVKWYKGMGFMVLQEGPILMARSPKGKTYNLHGVTGTCSEVDHA